jgi:hypothetical protein
MNEQGSQIIQKLRNILDRSWSNGSKFDSINQEIKPESKVSLQETRETLLQADNNPNLQTLTKLTEGIKPEVHAKIKETQALLEKYYPELKLLSDRGIPFVITGSGAVLFELIMATREAGMREDQAFLTALSLLTVGDIDILIPIELKDEVAKILEEHGHSPSYGQGRTINIGWKQSPNDPDPFEDDEDFPFTSPLWWQWHTSLTGEVLDILADYSIKDWTMVDGQLQPIKRLLMGFRLNPEKIVEIQNFLDSGRPFSESHINIGQEVNTDLRGIADDLIELGILYLGDDPTLTEQILKDLFETPSAQEQDILKGINEPVLTFKSMPLERPPLVTSLIKYISQLKAYRRAVQAGKEPNPKLGDPIQIGARIELVLYLLLSRLRPVSPTKADQLIVSFKNTKILIDKKALMEAPLPK